MRRLRFFATLYCIAVTVGFAAFVAVLRGGLSRDTR